MIVDCEEDDVTDDDGRLNSDGCHPLSNPPALQHVAQCVEEEEREYVRWLRFVSSVFVQRALEAYDVHQLGLGSRCKA